MPALAHWFRVTPTDIEQMSWRDLDPLRAALPNLPPIGCVVVAGYLKD